MSAEFLQAGGAGVNSTETNTVTIPAFALSGSNRHIDVSAAGRFGTFSISTISRGSDTYESAAGSTTGGNAFLRIWKSSNEPQEASASMTVTLNSASANWSAIYVASTGVDQTTRHRNTPQVNPDNQGSVSALSVNSAVGDLVCDACVCGNAQTGLTVSESGQTMRDKQENTVIASYEHAMSTKAGASTATMGWTTTQNSGNTTHIGWSVQAAPSDVVPDAPTITAESYSPEAIKVAIATVDDGGDPIIDTHIEYRESGASPENEWTRESTEEESSVYYIRGLSPNTLYDIQVIQENGIGESDPSTTAQVTTPEQAEQEPAALLDWADDFFQSLPPHGAGTFTDDDGAQLLGIPVDPDIIQITVPSPPQSLTATAISDTQIDLNWTAPLTDGGAAIIGYQIVRRIGAGEFQILVADTGTSGTSYQDASLTAETLYSYYVQAINSNGESAPSNIASDTTFAAPNIAPIADAGTDLAVAVGVLVSLDGSGSFDVNNDELTYLWSLEVPEGSLAVLSSTTIVNPTFLPDIAGVYTATLVVNDGELDSSPDTVLATVIELESITPMFIAAARVPTVPGERRKITVSAEEVVATVWKYPKDEYDVAVDWSGPQVLPAGATALGNLTVFVIDPSIGSPNDVSDTLILNYGNSPVTGWGTDGLISWVTMTGGTGGKSYTVIFQQTFDNGQLLEHYVTLEVRKPRKWVENKFEKYPNDKFPVPIQWAGRQPRGSDELSTLVTKAYDPSDVETPSFIAGSFVAGKVGAGYVLGGSAGDVRLIEFAQTFDNGRKFHEYALLTVKTPPA